MWKKLMRQGQNFNFGHAKFEVLDIKVETHIHVCPRSSEEWFEPET